MSPAVLERLAVRELPLRVPRVRVLPPEHALPDADLDRVPETVVRAGLTAKFVQAKMSNF